MPEVEQMPGGVEGAAPVRRTDGGCVVQVVGGVEGDQRDSVGFQRLAVLRGDGGGHGDHRGGSATQQRIHPQQVCFASSVNVEVPEGHVVGGGDLLDAAHE